MNGPDAEPLVRPGREDDPFKSYASGLHHPETNVQPTFAKNGRENEDLVAPLDSRRPSNMPRLWNGIAPDRISDASREAIRTEDCERIRSIVPVLVENEMLRMSGGPQDQDKRQRGDSTDASQRNPLKARAVHTQ